MADGTSLEDRMRERLSALAPRSVEIRNDSHLHAGHEGAKDGGGHFRVFIVSPRFAGASIQARHRMVYDALGDLMQRDIHALAITARAPEEFDGLQREESTE
jgi:BolA family transcriptional regulator, general stress-responsive regulator